MSNDVIKFIERFKQSNPLEIEKSFTEGNCYWFAFILKKRFVRGQLVYHPVKGHFAYQVDNHIYDITGEVDPVGFKLWSEYRRKELTQSKLIKRACIRLEEY